MFPLPYPAITIPLAVTLCYLTWCRARPFGPCRRCRSTGHTHRHGKPVQPGRLARLVGKPGRRPCRRCHGTGMRKRLGARLIHSARRTWHDATH